jgi:hypothetical protein
MGSKTPEWMPELIFCHRYEFAIIADQLGYRIGTRADSLQTNQVHKTLSEGHSIDFVDNNFKDPDWERFEEAVKITNPLYTVLPDVYDEQSLEGIVTFGYRLEERYDVTPIIVPKYDIDVTEIPENWIIGFSVPSGYGETDVSITRFTSHPVHLLGGSHKSQIEFANEAIESGVTIFSIDGNSFAKGASFGNIVNAPHKILNNDGKISGNSWDTDVDGYTDWGQRVSHSLARYYELWRLWSVRSGYKDQ